MTETIYDIPGFVELQERVDVLERAFRIYLEFDHSNAHASAEAEKILDGKEDSPAT